MTRDIFNRLRVKAERRAPGLTVTLHVANPKDFPAKRSFAYCTNEHPGALRIYVAPKLLSASRDRIEAVLRHEFAHAVYMHLGELDHTEREADKLAESLFGSPILYDKDEVQSLRYGVSPRPAHLG